jgi:hypothetical protein
VNTLLSFVPIIIAGIFVLLGGILIINHEKKRELKASHGESTWNDKH